PQEDDDRPVEGRLLVVEDRGVGRDRRTDLDDEHDRVVDLDPGVQLLDGVGKRLPQDLRVEQAAADAARDLGELAGAAGPPGPCPRPPRAGPSRTGPTRTPGRT